MHSVKFSIYYSPFTNVSIVDVDFFLGFLSAVFIVHASTNNAGCVTHKIIMKIKWSPKKKKLQANNKMVTMNESNKLVCLFRCSAFFSLNITIINVRISLYHRGQDTRGPVFVHVCTRPPSSPVQITA